jgi:uncharacterized tellurite resistance protein B-like protein
MRAMGRPRAYLDVLDDPSAAPIGKPTGPDALLMRMLAHMFHADQDVTRSELAVFARLVGPLEEETLREYLGDLVSQPLDYAELAQAFPDPQDRDDIVTLAEHGIWSDNRVEHGEVDMIEALMEALGVKAG